KKALEKVQAAHKRDKANVKAGAPAGAPGKKGTRGLTAREKALVKEFERRELSPADAEARRVRLKNLIVLGKERTYLTYSEINDHLPDDMMDAEQIENTKRIEDGLKHMIQAISACPTTIAEILHLAERIQKDEMRVDEVVDGLVDPNADEEEEVVETDVEASGEDEEDDAIEGAEEE